MFKPSLIIPRGKVALSTEERTQRTGTVRQAHLFTTHVWYSQAVTMQFTSKKAIQPNTSSVQFTAQTLKQFLLTDTVPQHPYKNKRKEGTSLSGRRVLLPRPLAWSCLVPTSHAAGEPSPAPLIRTRRSTTGRTAAPPVRVSTNWPRRATSAGTSEEGARAQKSA